VQTIETCSFETTFTWDFFIIYQHSFEITFILRHVKVKLCFHLLWITFFWSAWTTIHFFAVTWSFARWPYSFENKVALMFPGWLRLGCKCTHTLKHAEARKLCIPQVWKGALHLCNVTFLDQVKELCFVFLPASCIEALQYFQFLTEK